MDYLIKCGGKMRLFSFQIKVSLIILIGLLLPLILKSSFIIHLVFLVGMYGILSLSLNISLGYCGLANLAHGTFFGLGAYTAALLALNWGIPFYINLIAGGLVAMFFSVLLGLPTLRLKGVYLALATLGFGQIIRLVLLNWITVTRGPMGLPGIPSASILNFQFSRITYCYYILFLLVIVIIVSRRIENSRIGRAFFAIKNDPLAANSLGVNVAYYKMLAFAISTFIAGSVGSVYAHYVSFISPDTFTLNDSITILCMVILGLGKIFGVLLATVVLVIMPEVFRFAEGYRMVFVGGVIIVGILLTDGTTSEFLKLKLRYFTQKTTTYLNKRGGSV